MEMLVSGAFCGLIYALFAGQPLTIVGATGPMLVFESIVFRICKYDRILCATNNNSYYYCARRASSRGLIMFVANCVLSVVRNKRILYCIVLYCIVCHG